MSRLIVLATAVLSLLASSITAAQDYPVRPVRFIIGAAPDMLPRLVGQKLAENWGQQIVIDQRPAASGIIAGEIAAKAPPDGYTWLMSTASFVILSGLYPKLPYMRK